MEKERAIILVKAWPQPSKKYGETVCCAGVTPEGSWRRLFPIRFRHLQGDQKFGRWDIVEYRPEIPKNDFRQESRRLHENSIKIIKSMPKAERADFFGRFITKSISEAANLGRSLTLIRPRNVKFISKRKSQKDFEIELSAMRKAQAQKSLLEDDLELIQPCPYEFRIRFEDDDGNHDMECGDWETAATYFNRVHKDGEAKVISHLKNCYEVEYPKKGMVLALGTQMKYPKQWLLLGILRLDVSTNSNLI